MPDLDDQNEFEKVLEFELNEAFTYGNGGLDQHKREQIRAVARQTIQTENLQIDPARFAWWAFRLKVYKSGTGPFDIDNVPKLYIDAFCGERIQADDSQYGQLAFYEDDNIDNVKYFEIYGDRIDDKDNERTVVEIFGKTNPAS